MLGIPARERYRRRRTARRYAIAKSNTVHSLYGQFAHSFRPKSGPFKKHRFHPAQRSNPIAELASKSMNFLIVSAVFPPETMVTAHTSFQIADELLRQGHQVTVLAPFPSRPDGELFKGYKRTLYRRENMGFSVIRCFSFLSRKSSMGSRLLENIGFAITSSVACPIRAQA